MTTIFETEKTYMTESGIKAICTNVSNGHVTFEIDVGTHFEHVHGQCKIENGIMSFKNRGDRIIATSEVA